MSSSAKDIEPSTPVPFTSTLNAPFVVRRSIGIVKRTEASAVRSTFCVPASGRKRTTVGDFVVRKVSGASTGTAEPSSSSSPSASATL